MPPPLLQATCIRCRKSIDADDVYCRHCGGRAGGRGRLVLQHGLDRISRLCCNRTICAYPGLEVYKDGGGSQEGLGRSYRRLYGGLGLLFLRDGYSPSGEDGRTQ